MVVTSIFFFLGTGANYNLGTAKRNQPTKDKGQETKNRTKCGEERSFVEERGWERSVFGEGGESGRGVCKGMEGGMGRSG